MLFPSVCRKPAKLRRSSRKRTSLFLEELEDRCVPSVAVGQTATYYDASQVSIQPVTLWQGIRNGDTSGQYLITGTSGTTGLLFIGSIAGVGTTYAVNFPGATNTSVYGPNNLGGGNIQLVGSYQIGTPISNLSFLFQGTTADLSTASHYQTIGVPGATITFAHSTMGGLVVGNNDDTAKHGIGGLPLGPSQAFIYDIAQGKFITNVVFPGSVSDTAYGIWYNGGTSYTICGGYSDQASNNFNDQSLPVGPTGYLVDYDSATGTFSHWASFTYPFASSFATHFEGISSAQSGIYTLSADAFGGGTTGQGSWVMVRRKSDGSFDTGVWVNLNYPGVDPSNTITSSNSVAGNQVVGVIIGPTGFQFAYQASVNVPSFIATGAGSGGAPEVKVFDAVTQAVTADFNAFPATFSGGVRVAIGDVNGDGTPDIITGAGPGGGPQVSVYDGVTHQLLTSFFGMPSSFTGGIFVAAADINGDGYADIIVGADAGGGPQVQVFSGKDGSLLKSFFAFPASFSGGVRVAVGDVNGDAIADIVCGAGPGGGPQVAIYSTKDYSLLRSFYALPSFFTGGVYVAEGDSNGDGFGDVICGAGMGGAPQVTVFSGKDNSVLQSFYGQAQPFTGGVRVGFIAAFGSNGQSAILTAAGPGGGPQVSSFDSLTLAVLDSFFAYNQQFSGGVFVAA
jgi:hypothetical protein